jgi:hypothetical protein
VETNFDVKNVQGSPLARKKRWEDLLEQNKATLDIEAAKLMEADGYDVIEQKNAPDERTLCGCVERSPRGIPEWDWGKYFPGGTTQAKAIDSALADKMEFWAAVGHPCGADFIAGDFLKQHPEYEWMRGLLRDLKSGPWTQFSSAMKK